MYKVARIGIYTVVALAFLCHMTVLPYIQIFHARPDLLLICVIFFGFFLGPAAGLEAGIVSGLLKDIFSLDFFGINMLISGLAGLSAGAVNDKLFRDSKITQLALVFFLTTLSILIHYMLVSMFAKSLNLNLPELLVSSVIPSGIYTSLLSIPIFSKLIGIFKFREPEDLL